MKTTIKTLLVLITCFTLANCNKKQEAPKEKYCGVEITGFEIMDLKTIGNKGYTYTDADKVLAGDMMEAVDKMLGKTDAVKFSYFMRDENTIGMYVIGPDDQAEVEKISCFLLKEDFDGRLPKERKLLFYTNDHNTLVAAIKSKKEVD
ncbi:hypothetical protein DVK85_13465 [Flavobacterium arcticum]|uniref:Uncharacterized protein n=1 Tax=Flavobacterium arcticum TaxID=1784713 RepID=A0A345HF21_9FLAO|nr:hypothetical protein [Flavobacterium arcticum]AXG75181.1 hypothetical protein DVK85_13465 [Flavobacterium arcticum]KAF2511037.1 hypothetical protein E0W72_06485 [Flavobacterium arcticum]